jgi:DNA repair exonuclease SbcCD nuclease subunit
MKVLLRADAHCHPHSGSPRRASECLQAYKWSYDVAKEHGCRHVVDLGDVFHERHHINTWIFSEVYGITKEAASSGVNTVFILGNHDMYFRDSNLHNAINSFENLCTVVHEPKKIRIGDFDVDCFPYVEKNPQKMLTEAFSDIEKRSRVLFFHGAFDGALMSSASGMRRKGISSSGHDMHEEEVPESIDPSCLSGWEQVWGGHYHCPQTFFKEPMAQFVGSLLQHNKGEAGEQKRVVVLDLETLEHYDVINDFSPVFLKIDGDEEIPESLDVSKARIYVSVSDIGSKNTQEVCKELRKRGAIQVLQEAKRELVIDKDVQLTTIRGASSMIKDPRTMINRFAKLQAPAHLDPEKLVEIGMKIARIADEGYDESSIKEV